jgi:NSS family neurotransmitter:Na+ symporter
MTIPPVLLILVFLGSVFTPKNNDWVAAFSGNWVLDNSSLIKQMTNAGLREQIALSTDPVLTAQLEEKLWFINLARILLIGLFAGICVLVYIAHKKHQQQKHSL